MIGVIENRINWQNSIHANKKQKAQSYMYAHTYSHTLMYTNLLTQATHARTQANRTHTHTHIYNEPHQPIRVTDFTGGKRKLPCC